MNEPTEPTVSYTVDINGQWYGDELPIDVFDEAYAVEYTASRVLAGGTYEAHIVSAEWPDGTLVIYED